MWEEEKLDLHGLGTNKAIAEHSVRGWYVYMHIKSNYEAHKNGLVTLKVH